MAVPLERLPRYLVVEPVATVRIEIELESPACEIDVDLENPRPGRSVVLLIGHPDGPFVQRVRLAGGARILFDPERPGRYVLLLANPQKEPLVLRLRARNLPSPGRLRRGRSGGRRRAAETMTSDAAPHGIQRSPRRRRPTARSRHRGTSPTPEGR